MANWYVDSAATGTGSGDTPANAAINITSLFAALNVNSDVPAWVWVRRTFYAAGMDQRSMQLGVASCNVNSHAYSWAVGWPKSGDMWYDHRPQAGIDAGWDADANFWPLLCNSGTTANAVSTSRSQIAVTNFTVTHSGGTAPALSDYFSANKNSYVGEVAILKNNFDIDRTADHVVLINSSSTVSELLSDTGGARRITITASALWAGSGDGGALNVGATRIEEINVLSNSVSILLRQVHISPTQRASINSIGRIRGSRPTLTEIAYTGATQISEAVQVDDFYGLGPRKISKNPMGPAHGVSSATLVGSNRAWRTFVLSYNSYSISVGGNDLGNYHTANAAVRCMVQCTSGVPLKAKIHFCTASGFGSLDQNPGFSKFFLPVDGGGDRLCTVANSGIRPGSASVWTGSLIGVESYYMMYGEFTPQETVQIQLAAYVPPQMNANQHAHMFYSPFIEVTS